MRFRILFGSLTLAIHAHGLLPRSRVEAELEARAASSCHRPLPAKLPPRWQDDLRARKSPAERGFAAMRRRGLEPPPGYPGPGPQPGLASVLCVHCVPDRPLRPRFWTIWTHRTIWMLPARWSGG